jgi:hypothetical protein
LCALAQSRLRLSHRLVEAIEARLERAAGQHEVDPTAAQHVEHCVVLGQANRVVMWREGDACSQADLAGSGRNRREERDRVGADVLREVMFPDPERIEAQLFRIDGFIHDLRIALRGTHRVGIVVDEG